MPHSSKASRMADTCIARIASSAAQPSRQGASAGSKSWASALPPGNTRAPEAKSIWWWRTTMKTSSPWGPSRSIMMVAEGTGVAAGFPVADLSFADVSVKCWRSCGGRRASAPGHVLYESVEGSDFLRGVAQGEIRHDEFVDPQRRVFVQDRKST